MYSRTPSQIIRGCRVSNGSVVNRRVLIRLLGVTAATSVAGCAAQDDDTEATVSETESPTSTDSPTATETATPANTEMTDTTTTTTQPADDGLVTVASEESFDATVERITADIEESPLNLVTTIDHAANAASADLDLPPTTLLVFGNPAVGTPLMQASRTVAIDLPQKMLVWEADEETRVAYNDPAYLAERHDIDDQSDRLEQIRSVLESLATGE
ncbi:DUF302 domain-containing protein [Salinirubellus sp. GCM10025818]|uniref:DUF302 domain-containing protein n=2 Tax=Salinirubellus TaxID=2162630 RepID=UPI0030D1E38C